MRGIKVSLSINSFLLMFHCLIFTPELMVMAYMMENNPGSTEKLMLTDYKGERKTDLLR